MVATQRGYRQFVEDACGKVLENPLEGAVAATILGREDFVTAIQDRHLDTKSTDRDLPALRQLANRPAIDRIIEAAAREFGENERLAEKAAIYLCHRFSGAKLREIGERFGVKESAVSQASRRFIVEMDKDKQLKKRVGSLMSNLAR